MGKSKKAFIDKKNSSTYHLLYRSQRDVAGDDDDDDDNHGVVLWPSPHNNPDTNAKVLHPNTSQIQDATLQQWNQQLTQAGLVDNYDYEKHMKPITGTGDFFNAKGQRQTTVTTQQQPYSQQQQPLDPLVREVDRQLESIALTPDCMDDDIAAALFSDDIHFEDYEELNDEFVLDAAQPGDDDDDDDNGFDFQSHIQSLMEKAQREREGTYTIHEQGQQDQEFFSKGKALKSRRDDDDDDDDEDEWAGSFDENNWEIEGAPGVVPKLSEMEEKALCDKFAETLAEYDSDDIGEGYEDDDDVVGHRPLEGDDHIEAVLDDYLQEKEDDIFMQGQRHYLEGAAKGGSGFSALVGTTMVPTKQMDDNAPVHGDIRPLEDILGEADGVLANGKSAPPAEEIFIDGKSYYSEKIRNPWDCESILTTYSNLDNNPVTIDAGSSRRRRNRKQKKNLNQNAIEEEDPVPQILLSEKTGLPLGVLPTSGRGQEEDFGADTYMSVNKGERRNKKETAEEKKLRKQNIKKERELQRIQKKMMKQAFSEEFSKRAQEVMVDDIGGKSVFRF